MTATPDIAAATAASAPPLPLSKRIRRGWILELVGVYAVYTLYNWLREQARGDASVALHHAKSIVSIQDSLGISWERGIQQAFLHLGWFMAFWNIWYGTVHFVMPLLTLVVLYRCLPARYVRWRNTLVIMFGIAVLTFWLYPLMPPRLMPEHYGFVDTAAEFFNVGPQVRITFDATGEPTREALEQFGNLFAAMPSFHVGWSTWSVLALWPLARRWWVRAALVGYPLSILFCITVTANHWLLDAVGGWLVLALGYAGALAVERLGARRRASAGITAPLARAGAG